MSSPPAHVTSWSVEVSSSSSVKLFPEMMGQVTYKRRYKSGMRLAGEPNSPQLSLLQQHYQLEMAGRADSVSGWGTKIPHVSRSQKKKKKNSLMLFQSKTL